MLNKMRAYIDSYEEITLLLDKNEYKDDLEFCIFDGVNKIQLGILNHYEEANHFKYVLRNIDNIILHKDYYIITNYMNACRLNSGSIIRSKRFESEFAYDGKLGVEYSKSKSIFRIWTPVAKEVIVEIYKNGKPRRYPLEYKDKGVWECTFNADMDGVGYLYYVRVFDELKCIHDPYAISSSANGGYNYVINPDKFYKMKYKKPKFSGNYTDAIIYEASIRDFTYYLNDENKGTFLGMVENHPTNSGEATGLDYIASLGITHLQVLPVFDFGGVDDINKNELYNWGYNPEQYFIPCGWYSKNPNDPYSRINEMLEFVDECHHRGIRVNMDVVFNHVFKIEEFPFDYLVPGYFYRVDSNGLMSNASYCGNDLATERYMCSKFVCDVLKYYASVFNISGFRFDLMGLLDINTLKNAHIILKKIDDKVMMYGEGWNMNNPLPDEFRPHMYNHNKIPEVAFFNDRFRDFVRGSQFSKNYGFAFGRGSSYHFNLVHLVTGSCLDYYKFNNPVQSINYVECHDNYTFFDFGKSYMMLDTDKVIDASRLALELVIVSQGIPFIHAGEEFFRTKEGVENSYNTKDEINCIDYNRRDKYIDMVNTVKDLIKLRKECKLLRFTTGDEVSLHTHLLEGLIDEHTFAYLVEGDVYNLYIIIKNDYEAKSIKSHHAEMIFNGERICSILKDEYEINKPGVYLFKGVKGLWN